MAGVAAAQGHHSASDRPMDSAQFAGRPVDLYVSELPAAKKSASAVQPAQTVNQPRARLISLLLQGCDAGPRELVVRILFERLLVVLQSLRLVSGGLELLPQLILDRRRLRIVIAVHFEDRDRG